jgi:hypothetical protein
MLLMWGVGNDTGPCEQAAASGTTQPRPAAPAPRGPTRHPTAFPPQNMHSPQRRSAAAERGRTRHVTSSRDNPRPPTAFE